jgi:hypothetical protein
LEKGFSVELHKKKYITHVNLSDKSHDPVLIEGVLGGMSSVLILEDSFIEFQGKNGVIRIDVDPVFLFQNLSRKEETPDSDQESL